MNSELKKLAIFVGTTTLAVGLVASCGDDDPTPTPTPTPTADAGFSPNNDAGFAPADSGVAGYPAWDENNPTAPPNTTPINFRIDDSANATYDGTDFLAFKGSVVYDSTTRVATKDGSWPGPYPLVYDDGPWDQGGHEPAGETAGDNIWGVTFFAPNDLDCSDVSEPCAYQHGAIRNSDANGADGDWIWSGPNGEFTIVQGNSDPIELQTLTIPAHGNIDVRWLVNTATIAALDIFDSTNGTQTPDGTPDFTYDPADGVKMKSSHWAFLNIDMRDDGMMGDETAGDGIFTLELGEIALMGDLKHVGLLNSGDTREWIVILGRPMGGEVEYKLNVGDDGMGNTDLPKALSNGVTLQYRVGAGPWQDLPAEDILTQDGGGNPIINAGFTLP